MMTRQSISLTPPNDAWLKEQVESQEYTSKSDVVNDLIRRAREQNRETEWIRAKLIAAEKSVEEHGWVEDSPEDMLAGIKARARRDGLL